MTHDSAYEDALNRVTQWLHVLQPVLPTTPPRTRPYDNMLALLVDVSLQAAVSYDRVVLPRVEYVLQYFGHCTRTHHILWQLQSVPIEDLLQWRGVEKVGRFRALLALLNAQCVQSVDDLNYWSVTNVGREALLQVRGVGNKTYDYLTMLCGHVSFPIDRHIIRFLRLADVDIDAWGYELSQSMLFESCRRMGADPAVVERGLWGLMRSCS